jgi:enamine deaminase RidA (YjgF/YER057c/UK114 family)
VSDKSNPGRGTDGPQTARQVTLDPDPYEQYNIAQAHEVDNKLHISGQASIDQHGELVGVGDFDAQVAQVFENLQRVLAAGGSSLEQVLTVTIYLTDMSYFGTIVEAREECCSEPYSADTIVEVEALALPDLMLEIEAVALVDGTIE